MGHPEELGRHLRGGEHRGAEAPPSALPTAPKKQNNTYRQTQTLYPNSPDAASLLTIGSFLLTVDFFYLQLSILVFYLQLEFFAFSFSFLLTIGVFCLQWESASNKGPKGL